MYAKGPERHYTPHPTPKLSIQHVCKVNNITQRCSTEHVWEVKFDDLQGCIQQKQEQTKQQQQQQQTTLIQLKVRDI